MEILTVSGLNYLSSLEYDYVPSDVIIVFVCMCKFICLKFCRISHGVAKSWTWLSNWTEMNPPLKKKNGPIIQTHHCNSLEIWVIQHLSWVCAYLVTSWTVDCQAPLPMRFLGQEYWSVLPLPSPIQHLKSILIQLF